MATRVIGYVRVSTVSQAEEGVSLAAQERNIQAYCLALGLVLVGVEVDAGLSAKNLSRPGLRRALGCLSDGSADGLIVTKLDRLTRSVRDLGELVATYFGPYQLLSVGDSIDTRSPGGRLVLNVLSSVSQWEREAIGERTREGMQEAKRQGRRLGGPRLGDLPGEVATVERIRELRGEGMPLQKIADTLTVEGHKTKKGGGWAGATVLRVIRRVSGGEESYASDKT
jgi:DNA invertase Pin-like site-specific DNA recombinase